MFKIALWAPCLIVIAWAGVGSAQAQAVAVLDPGPPCAGAAISGSRGAAYSLDALVQLAAARHSSVAARRAGLEANRADLDVAKRQYFPTLTVQDAPLPGGGRSRTISLQQPVWAAGRLEASVDSATAKAAAAAQEVLESQQAVGFSVAAAYQSFLQARGRSIILQRFLQRLDGYRESMERRVASGIAGQSELELFQARYFQARAQQAAACHAEQAARNQLALLALVDLASEELQFGGDLPAMPALQALLDSALESSPALRRLNLQTQAVRAERQAKAADQWPTLGVVAQHSVPYGQPGARSASSVGIQLQYSPGAGFASSASARAAQAQLRAVEAGQEAARLELIARIRTEYEELRATLSRRSFGLMNVEAAEKVLASYDRLFLAGRRSWLDVLNSARELNEAELSVADLEAQAFASRYRLSLHAFEHEWMRALW